MRQIQHFFIDQSLDEDFVLIDDRDLLRQMKDVLRFRKGDACVLLDNRGHKAKAVLEEFHNKGARFKVGSVTSLQRPSRAVRLYVAVSKKPATLEWIFEKATELGVTELIPLDTERTQVHELRKMDRLHAIVKEASEQCERGFLPEIHPLMTFGELFSNPPTGVLLAGDPWKYDKVLSECLPKKNEDVNLVIGPEGGLSDEELSELSQKKATVFLLGETVLRMETAVIASLALVQYA